MVSPNCGCVFGAGDDLLDIICVQRAQDPNRWVMFFVLGS